MRFLLRVVLIVNSSDGVYRRYDLLGGVLLSYASSCQVEFMIY